MKIHQSKVVQGQDFDIYNIKSVGYTVNIPKNLNKYLNQQNMVDEGDGFNSAMATILRSRQYIIKTTPAYSSITPFYKTSAGEYIEMYNWYIKRCENSRYNTGFITKIWDTDNFYGYDDIINENIKGHKFCEVKLDINSKKSAFVFLTDADDEMQEKIIWMHRNYFSKIKTEHIVLEKSIEVTITPTLITAD